MNVNHLMLTRYSAGLDLKKLFKDALKEASTQGSTKSLGLSKRTEMSKVVRDHFITKYQEQLDVEGSKNPVFFFTKLRF